MIRKNLFLATEMKRIHKTGVWIVRDRISGFTTCWWHDKLFFNKYKENLL